MVGPAAPTARAADDPLPDSNRSDSAANEPLTSSGAENGSGGSGMSPQDDERRTKLGVLLVNLGAASEEKVFGRKGSAAMQAYRDGNMTDLLVIHRPTDDAAAHPFHWYNPWTWWSSGPQVSPLVRVPAAGSASSGGPPSGSAETATVTAAVNSVVGATQADETDVPPPPPAVEPTVKPKKKKGLPTVDMRPLKDDEVAALTPAVQDDRAKLLKTEAHLHTALQNIEDTRYRYLVPSRELHCEAEVAAVVRCYSERHEAFAAATAAALKAQSAAEPSECVHAPATANPVVRADLLACGPDVQRLKRCAEAVAMTYSHDGELK
ncbi:putative mitochondrial hypothetical protein [Leptomonas pyrrhocoris]|uniref:Uncharacterized protein n=1 Tax=Leptomonas pyrrhocoris TaxID=157538 RepID=A0A0N0DR14_LEPPY|nr:putative mitochondrial hypothetical protein [Leptomonas pyrrhocoris]KPA73811.1 putative mitochondrial hypothetical protein [Leptomonas pyrrhocoris]|eukprot:XP_015652250.1 putative mitochondrial hypothetical protein [Leptomonas pyrrhocoris]